MTNHVPARPSWRCTGCNAEWPCPTRRRELHAEYDGATTSLAVYLGTYFIHAAQDLTYVPAGWLHNRFIGWVHRLDSDRLSQAVPIMMAMQDLAYAHVPDGQGRCQVCGDPADCWVGIRD